jgi:hypothetical protein
MYPTLTNMYPTANMYPTLTNIYPTADVFVLDENHGGYVIYGWEQWRIHIFYSYLEIIMFLTSIIMYHIVLYGTIIGMPQVLLYLYICDIF